MYYFSFDKDLKFNFKNSTDYCNGYYDDEYVFVDKINNGICYKLCEIFSPKKIYVLNNSKRLYRKCGLKKLGEFIGYNGSEMNFSNWEPYGQMRILVPDLQNKIENDLITKIQYGPSIQRHWYFEELNSHPEWMLQDNR